MRARVRWLLTIPRSGEVVEHHVTRPTKTADGLHAPAIDSEGALTDGVRQAVTALGTCPVQEGVHCCWVEVEHLGPCQPPFPDFVQAQDRAVEPLALRP